MSRRYRPIGATIPDVDSQNAPATSTPAPTPGRSRRVQVALSSAAAIAAVALFAFLAMVRWDDWYLNYDGGTYLSLATNLRRGAGFVFPDGTFAVFRGPMYPALIAGAWTVVADTARSAIWVSRLILIANAVLLALIVWRLTKRWIWSLLAGAVVAVQPLVLISGALFFVPDGTLVLFVLAAVLVYVWHPMSVATATRLGVVGGLLGLAFLAKQTGALGGLVVVGLLVSAPSGGWRRLLQAAPALGLGFLAPVTAWSLYAYAVSGQMPSGIPGPSDGPAGLVVLALVIGGLVAWEVAARRSPGTDPGAALPAGVAAAAAFAIALAGLTLLGSAPIVPFSELWTALRSDLLTQIYRDTPWVILLVPLVIAIGWGVVRIGTFGATTGMLVTGVGLAGIVYSALAGAGFRNGLLVAYGLTMLLVLASRDLWLANRHIVWWRLVAVAGLVIAIAGSAVASGVTNDRLPERELTAENPAVLDASAWLADLDPDTVVAGTPLYLSTLWRLSRPHPILDLAPLHTIGRADWDAGKRTFPHRVDWAGTVSDPTPLTDPIGAASARVQVAAFMEPEWQDYLEERQPEYLVVTGNAVFPKSTFDGGLVLPYLEASPSADAVYRSGESRLPQWVVVYRLTYPFIAPATPAIVHLAADLPLDTVAPGAIVVSSPEYREMVVDILRRPLG